MFPRWISGLLAFVLVMSFVGAARCQQTAGPQLPARGILQGPDIFYIQGEARYADGTPARNIVLTLDVDAGGRIGTSITDLSGTFTFNGLMPGNYVITSNVPGYQSLRVPVQVTFGPVEGLYLMLRPIETSNPVSPNGSPIVSVAQLEIPQNARNEFEKGIRSMFAKNYADAAAHFEKAVSDYPRFTRAFELLAMTSADLGHFPEADSAVQKSLSLAPNSPRAYAYLGYVNAKENHATEAKAAFQKSIQLRENYWFPHLELGRLLLSQKEPGAAYPHLFRAEQLHPQLPSVHILLYNDLLQLGRDKDALAELDSFLTHFPDDPQAAHARQMRADLAKSVAAESH
ncbi:MAG: carboxypeptidase regulatory-like domain-containing protein [Acidobacteriota bacterium]|nr:carboxypeptidase regulatory-like domain-containing protein [Acidobacteriota bacterium]